MFWQLQGHVTSAVACDEERVSTVQWCQQHIYPNTHPSQSKRSGLQRISETCALYLHFRCKKTRRKKNKQVPVSLKSLWASGFNSPLEYVGTGECKDCFDWEKSAGKGKETEEWLFPWKTNRLLFQRRERRLSVWLPSVARDGGRDALTNWESSV